MKVRRMILFTLTVMFFINIFASPVLGIWWNSSWDYKKEIQIDGTGLEISDDYQLFMNVSYVADKMNSTFQDLRFTWINISNSSDEDLMFCWVQYNATSNYAEVWCKIPEMSNTTNTTCNMYYRNDAVETTSNGVDTFIFFDTFEGSAINASKWEHILSTGTTTVSGSILQVTGSASNYEYWKSYATPFVMGTILESKLKISSENFAGGTLGGYTTSGTEDISWHQWSGKYWEQYVDPDQTLTARAEDYTTYKTARIDRISSSSTKFYNDGVFDVEGTTDVPTVDLRVGILIKTTNSIYVDWVFVRNYSANDANINYSFGAEQASNTAPTITANATSPSPLYADNDWLINGTVTDPDGDTLTGYVQHYKNGATVGGVYNLTVTNNTNTLVATLAEGNFTYGDNLTAEFWAGDGTANTSKSNMTETVSNIAPSITLNSPSDDSTNTSKTVSFRFTPTDDIGFTSCSLWTNESGWSEKEVNTSAIVNNSINTIAETFTSDGSYLWNIKCVDSDSVSAFAVSNWTIHIDSISPTYSDNSTNSTIVDSDVLHSLKWEDAVGLSGYIFEFCNGTTEGGDTNYSSNTCSAIWGSDCGTICSTPEPDNTYDACATCANDDERINEIYLNSTAVKYGDTISVICEYYTTETTADELYVYYRNSSSATWVQKASGSSSGSGSTVRNWTQVNITVDNVIGEQQVRCIIDYTGENDECGGSGFFDNDDSNFTVVQGVPNFTNDSWVPMTGTANWSNVTKSITSTVGAKITWKVHANDTSDNWNTSDTYSYTTTTTALDCGTLNSANTVYTMTQNISSTGTCFTIGAHNITLDGGGHTINFSTTSAGSGILNTAGYDNLTIKNTIISQYSTSSSSYGIQFNDVINSNISNNEINIKGASSTGIFFWSDTNTNNIEDNNITTVGSTSNGMYITESNNNNITNNKITISGASGNGVELTSGSTSNIFLNNTIYSTAASSIAFKLERGSYLTSVTGGSIVSEKGYDYYLRAITCGVGEPCGPSNNFTDTNFTAMRKLYFYDTTHVFNYNNETDGNNWLKTKSSTATKELNRTLFNWTDNSMLWNDTASGSLEVSYTLTGLLASTYYDVTNTTSSGSTTTTKQTDSNGDISQFEITLNGNTQIEIKPAPPTFSDNSTNSTFAGSQISHHLKITAGFGLSGYIFSFDNGTGTLSNDSWVPLTGILNWSNVTKSVNDTVGTTIQWKVYANDTEDNWADSDTYSYVTTTDCSPPTSGNWTLNMSLNCNISGETIHLGAEGWLKLIENGSASFIDTILSAVGIERESDIEARLNMSGTNVTFNWTG